MAGIAKRATVQIPVEMQGMDKLKSLNSALDRITRRNSSMKKSFADTSEQLGKFNDIASDFGKRYKDMMEQTTTSNRDFTKSSRDMSRTFNEQQKEMQKAINRTKDAQKENADSTVSSNSRIRRSHENVGTSIDSNSRKMDRMSHSGHDLMMTGMNMSLAFSGATGAIGSGIKQATDLQDQYNRVRVLAQNGGESSREARRNTAALQRQGQNISTTYGIDQNQISQGNESLIRRGYTTSAARGSQPEYARAAISSGDDYNDVQQTGSSALEAFGQRSNNTNKMHQNTKRMLNQLTYGADLTASDYKNLGWALDYVGTTAHQSHQSSNQTIADLGQLSQQHIVGSRAGTSLRRLIEGLSNPKTNVLKNIGLAPKDLQDSHGNLKPISDDMKIINDHTKDMTGTQRYNIFKSLFGMQGVQAAQILATSSKSVDNLNKNVKNAPNMDGGQGYNAKIAAQNMKTFRGESNIAKQQFKAMTSSVAQQMLPDLAKMVGIFNNITTKINHMSNGQKRMVGWGTLIVGAMGPVTMFFGAFLSSVRSIRKALSGLKRQMASPMPRTATNSMGSQAAENEVTSSAMNPSVGTTSSRKSGSFLTRNSSLFGRGTRELSHTPHVSYAKDLSYGREGPEALSDMSKGASAIGRYGRSGGASRIAGPLTRGLSATRSISSKIPYLDLATSALPLIGMNHKNAGSRVGNAAGTFGGMESGAALGGMAGNAIPIPGVGAGIGSLVGGGLGALGGSKLGKSVGSSIQKHFPNLFSGLANDAKKAGNAITGVFHKIGATVMPEFNRMSRAFHKFENQWTHSLVGKAIDHQFIRSIKGLGEVIANFSKISYHTIGGLLKWLWNDTKDVFSGLGGIVKGGLKVFRGLFETVGDAVTGNWKGMFKGLEDMFWGFVHIFGSIGNTLKGLINNSLNGFQSSIESFGKWLTQKVSNVGQFLEHPIKSIEGKMPNQQLPQSNGTVPTREHARDMSEAGIPKSQQKQYNAIINKESSWNTHAQNGSGAYGIPQSLPSEKLLNTNANGKNPTSNPVTQLRWMRKYINGRYKNAANALNQENTKHFYGNGGWSSTPSIFGEVSGQPEVAINPAKSSADTLIQQAIQARSKYHKSQANKSSIDNLQGNVSEMMNNKSRNNQQKPIEVTQNITINGNADKSTARSIGQQTKQSIKQVIDEYFGEKNDSIFNS